MRVFSLFLISLLFFLVGCQKKENDSKDHINNQKSQVENVQKNQASKPVIFAQDQSDLKPEADIHYGVLKNGMRYAIKHNETPEKTASFNLAFNTGAFNEEEDQNGLAHLLEHMAFNGSKKYPEGEMDKALARLGLSFGGDSNAYTNTTETVYTLRTPDVSRENLDLVLDILRETTEFLTLDKGAVDRERPVVTSEYERGDRPGKYRYKAMAKFLFPGTIAEKRDVIGSLDVINKAPRQRLEDYYHKYYTPKRAFLVVVGDVNVQEMENQIETVFSDWQAKNGEQPDQDRGSIALKEKVDAYNFVDSNTENLIIITYLKPYQYHPDTYAKRMKDNFFEVAQTVLGKRLQLLERKPGSPLAAARVSWDSSNDEIADTFLVFGLYTKEGKWKEVLDILEQEVRKLKKYGITESELKEVLADWRVSLEASVKSRKTRSNSDLVGGIQDDYLNKVVFTSPEEDLKIFNDFTKTVTTEKVKEAFQKHLQSLKPQIFISSKTAIPGGKEAILKDYEESLKTKVVAPENKEVGVFAYQDFGPEGKVLHQSHVDDMDVYTVQFANGVLLNIKKTEYQKDRVSVNVLIGTGKLSIPAEQQGLNSLAETSFITGGLKKHSYDDLERVLAGHQVSTSFGVGNTRSSMSATIPSNDLLLQLQVFAAYLTDPAFAQKAYKGYTAWIETDRGGADKNSGGIAFENYARMLLPQDKRFGPAGKPALKQRTMKELKDWFEKEVKPAPVEISVVGDVEPDQVIKFVARTFGALPKRKGEFALTDTQKPKESKRTLKSKVVYHGGAHNSAFYVGIYPLEKSLYDTRQKRKVARILSAVLNDKLVEFVREKKGSYTAGSFSNINLDIPALSSLVGYFNLKPDQIEEFKAYVQDMAAEIKAGNVSDDALKRAKEPIIKDIAGNKKMNRYWLGQVSRAQSNPERLDSYREYTKENYGKVTKEQIIALANQVFKDKDYLVIESLPKVKKSSKK